MDFHRVTLQDREWIEQLLRYSDYNSCEYSFSSIFNWSQVHQTEVARVEDFGVIRSNFKELSYLYPFGRGDVASVIEQIVEDARQKQAPLNLSLVLEPMKAQLETLFPGRFVYQEERDYFDYLYTQESLATLKGRNLSGKRNHINAFKKSWPDWTFETISQQNIDECWKMNEQWEQENAAFLNDSLLREKAAIRCAFDHFFEEGLTGGLIRADGRVIAYTMGRPLNSETFVVHYEKALDGYRGAYQMINQQFAQHCCEGFAYINREDDTGKEGLRKAKLSYYPVELVKKYEVCLAQELL